MGSRAVQVSVWSSRALTHPCLKFLPQAVPMSTQNCEVSSQERSSPLAGTTVPVFFFSQRELSGEIPGLQLRPLFQQLTEGDRIFTAAQPLALVQASLCPGSLCLWGSPPLPSSNTTRITPTPFRHVNGEQTIQRPFSTSARFSGKYDHRTLSPSSREETQSPQVREQRPKE